MVEKLNLLNSTPKKEFKSLSTRMRCIVFAFWVCGFINFVCFGFSNITTTHYLGFISGWIGFILSWFVIVFIVTRCYLKTKRCIIILGIFIVPLTCLNWSFVVIKLVNLSQTPLPYQFIFNDYSKYSKECIDLIDSCTHKDVQTTTEIAMPLDLPIVLVSIDFNFIRDL